MSTICYSTNNSGGSWWLTDQNWKDLETAGWEVEWVKDQGDSIFHKAGEDRWLGALATHASREGLSMRMALAEFEDVTGLDPHEQGCDCCGQPHWFYEVDDEGNEVW